MVYYDDRFEGSNGCRIFSGFSFWCEKLATDITETTYLHAKPGFQKIYYWVLACDEHNCIFLNSEPAEFIP